jgi:uncharacterized membrane protein YagU involved in acid resistance
VINEQFHRDQRTKILKTVHLSMDLNNTDKLSLLLLGAAAGVIASVPMSISMNLMHRLLPEEEKYPLPPREITLAASERVGLKPLTAVGSRKIISTGVGHFGYGSFGGVVYAFLNEWLPLPPLFKGLLFGIFYWVFGYMGWVPAVGLLSPATKHPLRRTLLTITAHLVYGSGIALLMQRFKRRKRE